jgi:hypothetical protein
VLSLPGPLADRPKPSLAVPGSRLLIGETDGGRLLCIVIQPDLNDDAAWHVMTGWDANAAQRNHFRHNT